MNEEEPFEVLFLYNSSLFSNIDKKVKEIIINSAIFKFKLAGS